MRNARGRLRRRGCLVRRVNVLLRQTTNRLTKHRCIWRCSTFLVGADTSGICPYGVLFYIVTSSTSRKAPSRSALVEDTRGDRCILWRLVCCCSLPQSAERLKALGAPDDSKS